MILLLQHTPPDDRRRRCSTDNLSFPPFLGGSINHTLPPKKEREKKEEREEAGKGGQGRTRAHRGHSLDCLYISGIEEERRRARRRWSFFRTDWEERKDILDAIKGGGGGGGMTFVLSPFLREHVGGGAVNGATCVEPKKPIWYFFSLCVQAKREGRSVNSTPFKLSPSPLVFAALRGNKMGRYFFRGGGGKMNLKGSIFRHRHPRGAKRLNLVFLFAPSLESVSFGGSDERRGRAAHMH